MIDNINKNTKVSTVIFYAPVGNLIKGFKSGGAEAGCKKTMEVLQKAGYKILLVEKPGKRSDSKWDSVVHLINILKIWIRLIRLFIKDRNCVFHLAGFYLNQIYFEWLFIKTANIFKIRSIYEVRNGGMIEAYYGGKGTYKYFMRSTLKTASLVLCQGYDYVIFIKQLLDKESVYYPNYIMDSFVDSNDTSRENDKFIKLIYFGRVVPDKNVEFIIDVCKGVKLLNVEVSLDIIGSYEDTYYQILNNKVIENGLKENVIFHGRMDFKDMYKYLKSSHFFIFPSVEKREGHSNSLTEAMGCGIVPIVSTAGFNASIAGNPYLVINEFDVEKYTAKVADIWRSDNWKLYSDFVYNRVVEHYTESVVKKSLLSAYNSL